MAVQLGAWAGLTDTPLISHFCAAWAEAQASAVTQQASTAIRGTKWVGLQRLTWRKRWQGSGSL